MKCAFRSNLTPTKSSPKKLNAAASKQDVSPLKLERDPCTECEKSQETALRTVSPRRLDFVTEDKPVNNKENLLHRFKEVEPHDVDASGLQDSGYSSILQDSPYQAEEDSVSLDHPFFETPKPPSPQKKKTVPVKCTASANLFPALHFEEVVCSTLKRSTKRSQKVVLDIMDEVISRGNFGLENLIGKKMGLDQMDILGELFQRDFKHLVIKILRHLSSIDLINVIGVSTTWKKIVERDDVAFGAYKAAWRQVCEKEAKLSIHAASRIPLASVQKVASASCCFSSKKKSSKKSKVGGSSHSRHAEFNKVAKTLNNDQSLKVCGKCGAPAKYDSYLHRAICTRESCKRDFCTLCFCDYHSSKSCTTTNHHDGGFLSGSLPGSIKSKQNLRRL